MNLKFKLMAAALTTAIFLSGCATAGKDAVAIQTSPTPFSNFNCDQIRLEMGRLNGRVLQLKGLLDEAAKNDQAIVVAGGLLFWPALFPLGGTQQQETKLAQLKGEYDALQSAATQKKCS